MSENKEKEFIRDLEGEDIRHPGRSYNFLGFTIFDALHIFSPSFLLLFIPYKKMVRPPRKLPY